MNGIKKLTAEAVALSLFASGVMMYPALASGTVRASVKTKWAEDFVDGSAVLMDYGYKKGYLSENGWESRFLNLAYTPDDSISMGLEQDEELMEYYERNGTGRMIASSEMVALGEKGSYLQLMAEVNPNDEAAKDILGRFVEDEKLEHVTKPKERKFAGRQFLVCRGTYLGKNYMLGVSTGKNHIVTAFKTAYGSKEERKLLLKGFEKIRPWNSTRHQ